MQNFILKIGATLMVLINFTVSSMTQEDAEAIAARPLSYFTEEDYETIARTEHISIDEAKTVVQLTKMVAIGKMYPSIRMAGFALERFVEETGEDISTLCRKSIALYSNPAFNCDAVERIEAPKAFTQLIEAIDAYSRKDLVRITYLTKKNAHSDMVKLIMGLDAPITEKNTFISSIHTWIDSADLITSTTVPDNKRLSVIGDFFETVSERLASHIESQLYMFIWDPSHRENRRILSTIDNDDLKERIVRELKS